MRKRVVLVVLLALSACSDEPTRATPVGATRLFLDAVARSAVTPEARREVVALLCADARRRLEDRARATAALGASERESWEMLAEQRARLRFTPHGTHEVREGADESSAVVVVSGEEASDRAEVSLRREDDGWCVTVEIPEIGQRPAED